MKLIIFLFVTMFILFVLYLLAIMPRMHGKPDMTPLMGKLYAHRGLHNNAGDAPENSMKAFKLAVEYGFGIELDVQLSKDNIPVVFHDFTLNRVCGVDGKVCDYTYDDLKEFSLLGTKERIPAFKDVLELVNGKVPLIIELKIEYTDVTLAPIVDKLLSEYKGVYCIESFNPLGVRWYMDNRPNIVRGQLSDAFNLNKDKQYHGAFFFILENLLLNFLTKPDFIAYNCKHSKMLSRILCRRLYKNTAVAWTVKSKEQLREIKDSFDIFIFEGFIPGQV